MYVLYLVGAGVCAEGGNQPRRPSVTLGEVYTQVSLFWSGTPRRRHDAGDDVSVSPWYRCLINTFFRSCFLYPYWCVLLIFRGQPEIVLSNIETLVNVGLAQEGEKDYRLAQHVCNCILKISAGQKVGLNLWTCSEGCASGSGNELVWVLL